MHHGRRLVTLLSGGRAGWWKSAANAGTIDAGGYPQAEWVDDSAVGGVPGNARSMVNIDGEYAIRQTGTITRIRINLNAWGGEKQIKFNVFRQLGSGVYRVISESSTFTAPSSNDPGVKNFTVSMDARVGDFLGFTIATGASTSVQVETTNTVDMIGMLYLEGEATGDQGSWASIATNVLHLRAFMSPPAIAAAGDSIIRGGPIWHNFLNDAGYDILTYDLTDSPIYQIKETLSTLLEYQNGGRGSSGWESQSTTYAGPMIDTLPLVLVMHCGVNDVSNAVSWNDVEGYMDDVKILINAASKPVHLAVAEILPWTDGDDAQAATIRTWNGSYATWCAANGATLLRCHDAMGQTRVATGELDDLKAAYDDDGVHLTSAGVVAYAAAIKVDLRVIKL
jgi:hypothetical protein